MDFLNDDEIKAIEAKNKGEVQKPSGAFETADAEKVVEKVKEKCKCDSKADAIVLIAGVAQIGGTNRGAGKAISFTYKGKKWTSGELSDLCMGTKRGGTSRQLARTMGTTIFKIGLNMQEPGDLARQIKLDYPDLTFEEEVWCSNFQTANPDCPEKVRNWLKNNLRSRFEN